MSASRTVRKVRPVSPPGSKIGKTQRRRFLDRLALTGHVGRSAQTAGVAISTIYRLRRCDPDFAAAWNEAVAAAIDRIEDELVARALERPDGGADGEREEVAGLPPLDTATALRVVEGYRRRRERGERGGSSTNDQGRVDDQLRSRLDALLRRMEGAGEEGR